LSKPLVRVPLEAAGVSIGREVVLAEPGTEEGTYLLRSIPAFVYGVAAGDAIRILDPASGKFAVLARGGQITIRVFVTGGLERPDVKALIDEVVQAQGQYEIGRNDPRPDGASLLLVSLDSRVGFPKIERMLQTVVGPDVKWEYGNVYDSNGKPLNWWAH
jgi:hypothetical protein